MKKRIKKALIIILIFGLGIMLVIGMIARAEQLDRRMRYETTNK